MMNARYLILFIMLTTFSCRQHNNTESIKNSADCIESSSENDIILYEVNAKVLDTEEAFLANPHTITYHRDGYLLLQDKLESKMLLILDLKTNSFCRIINQGRAENELLNIKELILNGDDVYTSSLHESKLLKLEYDKANRNFNFSNSVTFSRQFINCAPTGNGYITLASASSGERIFLWDHNLQVTDTLGSYPTDGVENLKNANNAALQSDWAFSPDGLHFVTAYKKIDYIDIYESNVLKKRIRGPKIYDVTINRRKVGDDAYMTTVSPSHFAYKTVVADNNGFWVGYLGLEIKNGMIPTQDMNRLTKVFHFDWDGNLIQTYRFDNPVENFGIDPETNKMYCLTGSPDPRILIYELSD